MENIVKMDLKGHVYEVLERASRETGMKAYIVGGFVRDHFLGVHCDDIDVVVEGSGIEFARYIAENIENTKLNYYESYGTAMVRIGNDEVEFVGARKEMYDRNSRNPIVEDGTLEDDQKRRDFTMNAMAVSVSPDTFGEIIDPFNGFEDIRNRVVRSIQDPDITFSDDPLRIFRGIRLYTKLCDLYGDEASIDGRTEYGMMRNAYRTSILTQERITEELNKIFRYRSADKGVKKLYDLHLADHMCHGYGDVLSAPMVKGYLSSLESIGKEERRHGSNLSDIKWFIMFLNQYKIMKDDDFDDMVSAFRLPGRMARYFKSMAYLMSILIGSGTLQGMERIIPYTLGKRWKEFFTLVRAISDGSQKVLEYIWDCELKTMDSAEDFIDWKCPISGKDIEDITGLKEGKDLGNIKKAIELSILSETLDNDRDAALAVIKEMHRDGWGNEKDW